MKLLEQIQSFPCELKDTIYNFLPESRTIFLNKKLYLKKHRLVKQWIPPSLYDNYIRDMVRKDCHFVFTEIVGQNVKHWLKMKKYKYDNIIYDNYFYFLVSFCIEQKSTRCRELLTITLEKLGISKNQHKNNRSINIKWKH
jgi:hypothetical protein